MLLLVVASVLVVVEPDSTGIRSLSRLPWASFRTIAAAGGCGGGGAAAAAAALLRFIHCLPLAWGSFETDTDSTSVIGTVVLAARANNKKKSI